MELTVIFVKSSFLEKEEHFCLERVFPGVVANAKMSYLLDTFVIWPLQLCSILVQDFLRKQVCVLTEDHLQQGEMRKKKTDVLLFLLFYDKYISNQRCA